MSPFTYFPGFHRDSTISCNLVFHIPLTPGARWSLRAKHVLESQGEALHLWEEFLGDLLEGRLVVVVNTKEALQP